MSAASCLLTEDQFLCSICLDVFTDPVSLPCGHNFCNKCVNDNWDVNVRCHCPVCKRLYTRRPEVHVNTFISGMAAQFRQTVQQKDGSSEQQAAKPGEVPFDICTGTKLEAVNSCLICLASYCETHLKPHLTMSGLKIHPLIDPVENVQDKVAEYDGKKAEPKVTGAEIQQMIQKRQQKLHEIKHSVDLSKQRADREIAKGVQLFAALKAYVDRGQAEFIKTIREKQRTTEKQAEGFIKQLEEEISELKKRSTEVEQLSLSKDHLLQNFSSLKTTTHTKDWTNVSVCPPSYKGTVVRAANRLEETLSKQIKKVFEADLRRVQQYSVNVVLDPQVVYPERPQSNARQEVNEGNKCRCVFANQGFTSGRFYFEIRVRSWSVCTLGVARKSDMKGQITLSPNNGFWTLCLKCRYFAAADPSICLSLKLKPEKVGVFVNYEEGLVHFYDVDTAALLYSFTGCSFTCKVHPFFSVCNNDGDKIHTIDKVCSLQ